jgi:hypothetical protein
MKQFVKMTLLALFASAAAGTANAQSDAAPCNDKLIAGVYGFTIEGAKLGGNGPTGPQVGIAMTEFNGDGTLSQIDSVTVDGIQVAEFSETPTQGSYTVNPDCTGTFTLNFTDGRPTVTAWFVIVDNGNEIDTVVQGVPKAIPPTTQVPGVIATRSIGKRRFHRAW